MQTWLRAECGIEAAYRTVHQLVRYQLQAKLKVPRPTSIKLSVAAIEELKKTAATTRVYPEFEENRAAALSKSALLVRR